MTLGVGGNSNPFTFRNIRPQNINTDGNTQERNFDSPDGDATNRAAAEISRSGQIFRALNVPGGLSTGPIDVSSLIPRLGDQTGIMEQTGQLALSSIFNQQQRTLSIINYLNSSDAVPNPDFSYISGRPPYNRDTPEGRRLQDAVFAQLRTQIINQLTRVADQLQATGRGLNSQIRAARSFNQQQFSFVEQSIQRAFQGGQGPNQP